MNSLQFTGDQDIRGQTSEMEGALALHCINSWTIMRKQKRSPPDWTQPIATADLCQYVTEVGWKSGTQKEKVSADFEEVYKT